MLHSEANRDVEQTNRPQTQQWVVDDLPCGGLRKEMQCCSHRAKLWTLTLVYVLALGGLFIFGLYQNPIRHATIEVLTEEFIRATQENFTQGKYNDIAVNI